MSSTMLTSRQGYCTIMETDSKRRSVSELSNYLNDQLKERGWEQKDLVARSGLPKATVSRVLGDKVETPDLPTFVSLAEALGVSLAFLLERAGYTVERLNDPEESTRQIARQIEAFPWLQPILQWLLDLDPEDRAGVVAYFEALRRQRGQGDQGTS
jgi:transcriptional regulator with XRE-family HTH domain